MMRTKTNFYISQTLSVGELRERRSQELIPAGQSTNSSVATVALNATIELFVRYKLHDLGKHRSALFHLRSSS